MTFDDITEDGRLWAVRYDGEIKLTLKMEEREHTRLELVKMEKVRSFLLNENIIDDESFVEYMNTI